MVDNKSANWEKSQKCFNYAKKIKNLPPQKICKEKLKFGVHAKDTSHKDNKKTKEKFQGVNFINMTPRLYSK